MDPILVVGKGPEWEQDMKKAVELMDFFKIMAVGMDCPWMYRIDYFVTYHYLDISFVS